MTTVQKFNNDAESKRYQKNMTDTQKKNNNSIKEGIIVNSFVKDPLLSLDETLDTLVISQNEIEMPTKVYEKEHKKNNSLLFLSAISAGVMFLLGAFTGMIKKTSKKHLDSTEEYLLPGITRNHCINNEIHQSIFSMIQSPNRKTILASIGVISLAATAFICKNIIDGYKDVWIKRREADIQKNLQENLIAVETQSFSGKMQIIRSMLSTKAKEFSTTIEEVKNQTFKGKIKTTGIEDKKNNEKCQNIILFGILSIISILGLGYYSIKNIRKSEEFIKQSHENTKRGLDSLIRDFNNNKSIIPVKDHEGNVLKEFEAYKYVILSMLEKICATPRQIEEAVEKINLPYDEKENLLKYLKKSMNQSTEKVNSAIGGSGRNKITYFSHVNDYLSFFYDWLMNPKNPQFKNLFIGIFGVSALAYGGKTIVEAFKDIEVKKYNAETELDLQKRLVSTELRNFKAKKESVIEPLCEEFYFQKNNNKSPEELKIMADNILFEIKNGAPFVYS